MTEMPIWPSSLDKSHFEMQPGIQAFLCSQALLNEFSWCINEVKSPHVLIFFHLVLGFGFRGRERVDSHLCFLKSHPPFNNYTLLNQESKAGGKNSPDSRPF